MSTDTRHRSTARWTPEPDPDRKSLENVLAFAYGMQMGHLRRMSEDLTQLARQAKLATMAAGAAIAVEHQHHIECIARSGDAAPQIGTRPAANTGLAGECLRTGLPQLCGDTETHPFVDRLHSRSWGMRSIVYVPVFRGSKAEGVVGVFADRPNHFTPHDVRVLQMIAGEVGRTLKWVPAPMSGLAGEATEAPSAAKGSALQPSIEIPARSMAQALMIAKASAPQTPDTLVEELAEDARPLFEPDLTTSLEPDEDASIEPSQTDDFDWTRPPDEDLNYPARATSYLFAEEHPVRRRVTIATITAAIVCAILGVWWAVPKWTADNNLEPTADYIAKTQQRSSQTDSSRTASLPSSPTIRPSGAELVFVRDIRTQVTSGHVFVTVHLSGPVQFQTSGTLDRIFVDLHGVQLSPLLKATRVDPAGPIAQFRLTPANEPDVIRLAMVLDAPCTFLVSVTSDPQAIVLDVQPQRGIRPTR